MMRNIEFPHRLSRHVLHRAILSVVLWGVIGVDLARAEFTPGVVAIVSGVEAGIPNFDIDFTLSAGTFTQSAQVGGLTSDAVYDFSDGSGTTTLHAAFSHVVSGETDGVAFWGAGIIFQVGAVSNYELSGFYDLQGLAGVGLSTKLKPISSSPLFNTITQSNSTANESLILGQALGDSNNVLVGSLTGTLQPGTSYLLQVKAFLEDTPSYAVSNASGEFSFTITETQPIPLPATAVMLLAGVPLGAFAVVRRYRNRRRKT